MTKHVARLAPALVLALCQLSLFAQSPARQNGTPTSWADDILKKETYATPPPELVDAVLAPRHLNISLSNASADKKWFLDEIGDGPVIMKTFSKPFHEFGGVFIDYQGNRARALTIRNNVGIQLISAADGSRKPIQIPAGVRVSNATYADQNVGTDPDNSIRLYHALNGLGKTTALYMYPLEDTVPRRVKPFSTSGRAGPRGSTNT